MKKIVIKWIGISIFLMFFTGTSWAHSVWMDVSGDQVVSDGDTITVNVYAHADDDDAISMFSVSIGFDDAALGGELTYVSYSLNLSDFVADSLFYPGTYEAGGSELSSGDSWVYDIGAAVDMGADSVEVDAGEDLWLFSITFAYTNAETTWSGDDIWIEFNSDTYGGVFWDGEEFENTTVDSLRGTADFAAVPVPGTLCLMFAGLAGLIGFRRG